MRILVVDDHPDVLDLVTRALERDHHVVSTAAAIESARERLAASPIELLILDLGLPDGSGQALCAELRAQGSSIPILVLTAKSAVASRVAVLDAGADDYLGKPFAVAELRARVRALGRRGTTLHAVVHEHGGVTLDFSARRALVDGQEAAITSREWSILQALAQRNGRVIARHELLDSVWGDDGEASSASLDVLIARIRRKLGADVIRTVRGQGYALAG
jgi:two-component system OmpR family response regulator